ncbi:MAG: carbohydrate ABC transporter permease [Actinomyces urogenitalis]|uniref:carbohydrate ABC transporter permease n=1 Tax=Actinomyces urogenitalis TaxID=103621 RepID=UPI002A8319F9|nr:carbohydrate ABC transporter permease [Actinomyces urogenitalis]MDY3679551.1 carbohydrate ABC transporter permease [Actinomyces urogenitalis]
MNHTRTHWIRHLLLMAGAVSVVGPFVWMLLTAVKSRSEVFTTVLPTQWHWENFAHAWQAAPFGRYYLNSVIMTVGIVVGHIVLDSLAAYAFARLRFPWKRTVFFLLLATMLVPTFVTVIPAFSIIVSLGWIDSYQALIVPRLADVFGIVLLRQYFSTIPRELEEAARIDGCSRLGVFLRIVLPLSRPALATLTIFAVLFSWNDFLWPLLVTNGDDMRTIQVGLTAFQGRYGTSWHLLMAGTLMATVPTIIMFLFFQRSLVRGLTSGGVKE